MSDAKPRCDATGKVIFLTFEEAGAQRGTYAYRCRSCHLWHRTGSAIAIARKIARGPRPGGLYAKPGRAANAKRPR